LIVSLVMATKINVYLNFDGTAEEAFNFYKSIFGGEFDGFQKMKDAPEGDQLSPSEQERMMHIALPLPSGDILMASDIVPSRGHTLTQGNNYYVSINLDDQAEAERLFAGLSEGGAIESPFAKMFWGDWWG